MKRIVICGAGEIGRYASEVLAKEGYDICVVDISSEKLQAIEENVDITSIAGSCCLPDTIHKARVDTCDTLIAATDSDEVNLLTAAIAKRKGAKKVIARIHDKDFLHEDKFCFLQEFGIDHLICPEKLTSEGIVANLADPSVLEVENFDRHDLEMHRYKVPEDSPSIGIMLSEMDLPLGVRLAVVSRQGLQAFIPDAKTRLAAGDIVTIISSKGLFQATQRLFSQSKSHSRKDIAILGSTPLTEWLIADLSRLGFEIRIFEPDRDKALVFSEENPRYTVLSTNPTDPAQFRAEQLERCDAFISATDDDEHNILSALQAKKLGVEIAATVVHAPTFLNLLENIGIDLPFSPRIVAARELLKIVDDSQVKCMATLAPNIAFLYEVFAENGRSLRIPLKNLKMPKGTFIATITRDEEKIIPSPDDEIHKDDTLVIVGPPNLGKRLKKMFVKS
ncbi:MAG: Trk system potassium transporter TrkA [Oligoflexales bacterium]|nr:Trk system potassium transporter TrkA [Oligoflexales bacterium]